MSTVTPFANPDAEAALIGLLLVRPDVLWRCDIESHHFAEPLLRELFVILRELSADGPTDIPTVADALRRRYPDRQHASAELFELAEQAGVSPEPLCAILRDCVMRRTIDQQSRMLAVTARDMSADPVTVALESFDAIQRAQTPTTRTADATATAVARVESLMALAGRCEGVPTGFQAIDALLGGLPRGELTVLAARPGMGKSALAHQIATHVGRAGRVLLASPEMANASLADRMIAQVGGIPLMDLRLGRLSPSEWVIAQRVAASLPPITLFDQGAQSPQQIIAEARRLSLRGAIDLVVVDHLQYLAADERAENRTNAVGRMVQQLKQGARALNCAVLLLSQLNRGVEAQKEKRPMLSHLRDSGDIEQDADVVLFLYRPGYYDDTLTEAERAQTELIVAKDRNGPVGTRWLSWEESTVRFFDAQAPFARRAA